MLAWRRLEKWTKSNWRKEVDGTTIVPIWKQRYFKRVLDAEKVVRIKKTKGKLYRNRTTEKMKGKDKSRADAHDVDMPLCRLVCHILDHPQSVRQKLESFWSKCLKNDT